MKSVNQKISLILVIIMLLQIVFPIIGEFKNWVVYAIEETITMHFPDENLYNAIKEELEDIIKSSNDVTNEIVALKSDLESVKYLYLSQKQIKDITGIENFTNLTSLNLGANLIADIEALSELTKLTDLNLRDNQISNIEVLSELTNLIYLNMQVNKIGDISVIDKLPNINEIDISFQTIELEIEDNTKEIELPAILLQARDSNSIAYTEEAFELDNCKLSQDRKRIILNDNINYATIEITDGKLGSSKLIIERKVKNIELVSMQKEYVEKENMHDFNKLKITYNNGTTRESNIDEKMVTGYDNTKIGEQEITITYKEKTIKTKVNIVKDEEITMYFPDENLYTSIKESLENNYFKQYDFDDNKNEIKALRSNIKNETGLLLSVEYPIGDLTGIENFVNVTYLHLAGHNITNIDPLKGLINLEYLDLGSNKIEDISALKELKNLEYLGLSDTEIGDEDLENLKNLTNLSSLNLESNEIEDISALKGLTNLKKLLLNLTKINSEDLENLKELKKLDTLELNFNEVNNIGSISGLTNLSSLSLERNEIKDISALKGLTNLTKLNLGANLIADIEALRELTNLTVLDLGYNKILSDISILSQLKNLEELNIGENQINNISPLRELINLKILYTSENRINDISALSKLVNIEYIYINDNRISDISVIEKLPNIENCNFFGQTVIAEISDGTNEMKLPAIFEQTKKRLDEWEFEVENCTLNEQENKIILNHDADYAEVILYEVSGSYKYNRVKLTVEREIANIELIGTLPAQLKEEYFDRGNAKLNIVYKNGREREIYVNTDMISGYDNSKLGEQEITITYGEKTIETKVNVIQDEEITMHFPDKNLYIAIKEELGDKVKSYNDESNQIAVLYSDIIKTIALELKEKQIKDITGIENFVNLISLDLDKNNITNIEAISQLHNLKILYLGYNQISDIEVLSKLKNLYELALDFNKIDDMTVLDELENLSITYLTGQTLQIYIPTTTKEVNLPQIFKQAKDKASICYTEEEFKLENCILSEDGTKVIINQDAKDASVTITGGELENSKLVITKSDEIKPTLLQISVTKNQTKMEYTEGENFDKTGMEITATYSDGTTKVVEGYIVVEGENLSKDKISVTISYTENGVTKTTTQDVIVKEKTEEPGENPGETPSEPGTQPEEPVEKELSKIEVTKNANRISYTIGENFDKTGMEVLATYSDGTTKVVEGYIVTDGENLSQDKTSVTISYTENGITKETKQIIMVKAKVVTAIKVNKTPTKVNYTEGENFDKTGIELIAIYSDGTIKVVEGYTVIEGENLSKNQTSVTISYTENGITKTVIQNITVEGKAQQEVNKLNSIAIVKAPNKISYIEGQNFDKTGMEVIAKYTNGETKKIEDYNILDGENLAKSKTTVTIYYKENGITKTVTQNIIVEEKILDNIKITKIANKINYIEGQKFDKTGMEIVAIYNNGQTKKVENYQVANGESLSKDQNSVTISYAENGVTKIATQNITVKEKVLNSIRIENAPDKTTYLEGQNFDKTGMEIVAIYNNGQTKKVENYQVTNGESLSKDKTSVTISYEENGVIKETTQRIVVTAKQVEPVEKVLSSIKVSKAPTKTSYIAGENFDKTGMEVLATYSDGTTKVIDNYTVKDGQNLSKYRIGVTISYIENGVTKTAVQTIIVQEKAQEEPGQQPSNPEDNKINLGNLQTTIKDQVKYINIKDNKMSINSIKETIKNANKESDIKIEVTDEEGKIIEETEEIKTNDTIKITKETKTIEYKAVKMGYINKDNKITISDLMKLLIHLAEENAESPTESKLLKGAYLMAADINGNGKIDMLDILPLVKLTIK